MAKGKKYWTLEMFVALWKIHQIGGVPAVQEKFGVSKQVVYTAISMLKKAMRGETHFGKMKMSDTIIAAATIISHAGVPVTAVPETVPEKEDAYGRLDTLFEKFKEELAQIVGEMVKSGHEQELKEATKIAYIQGYNNGHATRSREETEQRHGFSAMIKRRIS